MNKNEIYSAIKNGTHKDLYSTWKNHEDFFVRLKLAEKGYFTDEFIDDENGNVILAALEHNPSKLLYVTGKTGMNYAFASSMYFCDKVEVEKEILDTYINREDAENLILEDIILKRKSIDYQLTKDEENMDLFELYQTGTVGWAKKLTCNRISRILHLEYYNKKEFEDLQKFWLLEDEIYGK